MTTRDLCIMACAFCREQPFRDWLQELAPPHVPFTEDMAKAFITEVCEIESRKELDTNAAAAERFHRLVRLPFVAWKAERPRSEGLSVEHSAAPLALGAGRVANAGPVPGAHRNTMPAAAPVERKPAFAFINLNEEGDNAHS